MNRIAELRKEFGFTQVELAEKVGVHQTAVSQWESGKTNPEFETLEALCSLFDVSLYYLLGRDCERGHHNLTEEEMEQLGAWEVEAQQAEFIEAYKGLDYYGATVVEAVIRTQVERMREEKRERGEGTNVTKEE